jgi:hypothetical protein
VTAEPTRVDRRRQMLDREQAGHGLQTVAREAEATHARLPGGDAVFA